jgi:hypothetical protein
MFTTKVLSNVYDTIWNELVKSVPEGTVYQCTYWANFMKEYMRMDPLYIIVNDENGSIAGAMLLFRQGRAQSLLFERPLNFITIPILKKLMTEYTWMYSPLIFDKTNAQEITRIILKEVGMIAGKSLRPSIRGIIPPMHGDMDKDMIHNAFLEAGYIAKPWATFLVDLKPDIEELWMKLKKTGRKGVKHCQEQGIQVEMVHDLDELKKYYGALKENRNRLNLRTNSFSNFSVMWKHLHEKNCMEVFLAKHNGMITDGLGIIHFNGVLSEIAVARSDYAYENQINGGDLIKWEIIKWGHENGHRLYDLQGFNPKAEKEKEKNIRQFKEKWGGYSVDYMIYDN